MFSWNNPTWFHETSYQKVIFDLNKKQSVQKWNTHIDLYIFSPFGPTCWFCNRVFTKSSGKTHETPIIPAIPPFMIFGSRLKLSSKILQWTKKKMWQIIFRIETYANCLDVGAVSVVTVFVVILNQEFCWWEKYIVMECLDAILEKTNVEC